MVELAEGWDSRTRQKLFVAGCLAAGLSLRNNPLRVVSPAREFVHKLVGYGSAALLFSAIQESCRALRGRHDFINSAISGAVTGGLVVGHYQGPKYRLLGVVTWGGGCALLHLANSALQPRVLLEDYLIREGLLSPEVARRREHAAVRAAFAGVANQDVIVESLAIRERELKQLNDRLAAEAAAATAAAGGRARQAQAPAAAAIAGAAAGAASPAGAGAAAADVGADVADDDAGYLAWLQLGGLEADVLLQQQQQQQQAQGRAQGQANAEASRGLGEAQEQAGPSGAGTGGSGAAQQGHRGTGAGYSGRGGAGAEAHASGAKPRTWAEWLASPWRRRSTTAASPSAQEPGRSL
ncbi:hypothetical protein HYH03_005387 [Edaphochlamys debaryana]|uniref:Uncharacterized protein n=1 Tax=Edaphochlamys debaryana TaxID=47281 RepID=A0A835YCZ3_9CHLO|nr:hypothetical protein HYH03_005387 [Edaphochlamys debaryana]|eukprot:KAG2496565.1 hypothetical protein HYH03_005387 [Edaphochlamys debaryana]